MLYAHLLCPGPALFARPQSMLEILSERACLGLIDDHIAEGERRLAQQITSYA